MHEQKGLSPPVGPATKSWEGRSRNLFRRSQAKLSLPQLSSYPHEYPLPINLNPQKIIKRNDVVVIFLKEGKEGAEEFVGAVAAVVEEDDCAIVEAF